VSVTSLIHQQSYEKKAKSKRKLVSCHVEAPALGEETFNRMGEEESSEDGCCLVVVLILMNDWIATFIPLFIYRQVIAYLICKTRKRIPVEFGSAIQKLTFFIVSFSKKYAK